MVSLKNPIKKTLSDNMVKCPRCGTELEEETEVIQYKYFCPECDENFYEFELAFSLGKNAK